MDFPEVKGINWKDREQDKELLSNLGEYIMYKRRRLNFKMAEVQRKMFPSKADDTPLSVEPAACKGCPTLPRVLYWPNLEVIITIFFIMSVAEASAAIISHTSAKQPPNNSQTPSKQSPNNSQATP